VHQENVVVQFYSCSPDGVTTSFAVGSSSPQILAVLPDLNDFLELTKRYLRKAETCAVTTHNIVTRQGYEPEACRAVSVMQPIYFLFI
jgi:hypothetical protein